MKKSIIGVVSLSAILTAVITSLICQPQNTPSPSAQTLPSYSEPEPLPKKEDNHECISMPSKGYKLKEYEGNLAIFKSDAQSPIKITSIEVGALPIQDQELLKNGIDASSEEELNNLIEDYCS